MKNECKNFEDCGNYTDKTWCKDCAISHIAKKSGYKPFAKINDVEGYCLVLVREDLIKNRK